MTQVQSTTDLDRPRFYIDGRWVEPTSSETHTALEAATENVLGTAALGSPADMDAAVKAARRALDHGPWGRTTVAERVAVMRRFAAALAKRGEFTSRLTSQENGMPIALSEGFNGQAPAGILEYFAALVEGMDLEEVRESPSGSTIVRRESVGVVAAITPWNYPHALALIKISPALAAGCTVVLKPSPETALDSYVIADAAEEAGIPPGVLNIVLGGREAGAALVAHPGVDKVAFTGSTAAGKKIGEVCGSLVRRVTLELGGKSASIVLDDADMDTFVAGLPMAAFMNNGQTCTTTSRILAPRARYQEVLDTLVEYCRGQVVGDPLDRSTTLGPMASSTHLDRVMSYVELGKASSARLVTGGGRPAGLDRGWFVEPTVFADVDNSDRLAREEIFGPVLAVMPYDGVDQAVDIANDSEYGLCGVVWTTDEDRGLDVARRVRTGTVGVNYFNMDLGAPFGGMKSSGIGRELGAEGLGHYFEYKSMLASAARLNR
ncbi:MAG: aldehyde dehydrogenase [Pseudonocardia sp. SCN 72-86]|nr:MAG: aldehyde dehydrogenase [Pseudonocardia sp. SCN 72-86]